jgi:hypothetical protein
MSLWRPFEEYKDKTSLEVEGKAKESMKIRVGEAEKAAVLDAYLRKSHEGWKVVLNEVKIKMSASNTNMRIQQFYIKEEENKVVRRIQRILREETKAQAVIYHKTVGEKRKKIENVDVDVDSDNNDGDGRVDKHFKGETSLVAKQMRYARKQSPEERKKAKLSAFVDTDESSDDEEAASCQVKKKKTLREASLEAQESHSKMCEASMKTMGLMADVLKKLEQKLDQ